MSVEFITLVVVVLVPQLVVITLVTLGSRSWSRSVMVASDPKRLLDYHGPNVGRYVRIIDPPSP